MRLCRSSPSGSGASASPLTNGQRERLAERRLAGQAEGPAKRIVDEAEPQIAIAAEDHVALVIEQIAIARLALAHLPLQVFQRLEALIETLGQSRRGARRRLAASAAANSATMMATPTSSGRSAT